MRNVIVIGPDQIESWLEQEKKREIQPCTCERAADLTNGMGPVRNIYCHDCKSHVYGEVRFNAKQWNKWINSNIVAKIRQGKIVQHTDINGKDIEPKEITFDQLIVLTNSSHVQAI